MPSAPEIELCPNCHKPLPEDEQITWWDIIKFLIGALIVITLIGPTVLLYMDYVMAPLIRLVGH